MLHVFFVWLHRGPLAVLFSWLPAANALTLTGRCAAPNSMSFASPTATRSASKHLMLAGEASLRTVLQEERQRSEELGRTSQQVRQEMEQLRIKFGILAEASVYKS